MDTVRAVSGMAETRLKPCLVEPVGNQPTVRGRVSLKALHNTAIHVMLCSVPTIVIGTVPTLLHL